MKKNRKVCFLLSANPSIFDDPRIFNKEAKSLSKAGYEVIIIIQHDREEIIDGIRIVPLRRPKNRFDRMAFLTLTLLHRALKEKAHVYHFHNPELIFVGLFLKLVGKKVIYDVHEAFSEKILSKRWIKKQFQPIVSRVFSIFERSAARYFDYIIPADRVAALNFKHLKNVCVIANYPVLGIVNSYLESKTNYKKPIKKDNKFILIYAGFLEEERGFSRMLNVMEYIQDENIELHLMGRLADDIEELQFKLQTLHNVVYLGFIRMEEVYRRLLAADIGLILFQPVPAYLYAGENTTKLFEYMLCELPIIAPDFPNLREIIESIGCGICVDPTRTDKIVEAIRYLYNNPDLRKQMGERGKKAVLEKYNWESDAEKLLAIYAKLCN